MLDRIFIFCILAVGYGVAQTPKSSGIIVNPLYDPKDDVDDKKKSDPNEILPPTHQQLSETFNLRNIINNAVRMNTYVVRGAEATIEQPKKPILPWLSFLLSAKNSVGSSNGADEMLG
ncbi:hypothetical protein Bhyg_15645, partial [Pseudolycoriella hygida]